MQSITPVRRYTQRSWRAAAAVVLARCAKSMHVTESAQSGYAADAVKALEAARRAGFRDAAGLAGPEWDVCRMLEGFQKVVKGLSGK